MKKALNGFILFAMIASIVVQYNDPDGILWALVYFYGAVMARNAFVNKYDIPLLIIGIVLCVGGAVALLPPQWTFWITNEVARETGGLGVTAIGLIILLIQAFMQKKSTEAAPAQDIPEPA